MKKKLTLPPLTEGQKHAIFTDVMREMGAKGGANSRKNLPDQGEALGRRAVETRWARYHAGEHELNAAHVIPPGYTEAVAAMTPIERAAVKKAALARHAKKGKDRERAR